jgi:hypothetical protein
MAPAVDQRPQTRPILVLHSRETFSDDLGGFGERVPLRGSVQSDKADREDFALRRLLVGLRRTDDLAFPLEVRRGESGREPDYVLTFGDRVIGVEVTTATEQDREKRLSREASEVEAGANAIPRALQTGKADDWSKVGKFRLDGGFGDRADDREAREARIAAITAAIERKVRSAGKGDYDNVAIRWLCLYDNSRYALRGSSADVLAAALVCRPAEGFDRVFLGGMTSLTIADAEGGVQTIELSTDYDIDFVAWAEEQARLARDEGVNALDLLHVAEELEDLGNSQRHARGSQLERLLAHLLKLEYQLGYDGRRSWRVSCFEARKQLQKIGERNPSLSLAGRSRQAVQEVIDKAYGDAREWAARETEMGLAAFPETCPYTIDQILDPDFLPGPERDEDHQP